MSGQRDLITVSTDSHSLPEHRPLLIFNHNPKAGGGSILRVLRDFKTREKEIVIDNPNGLTTKQRREFAANVVVDDLTFIHVREGSKTRWIDRQIGYVIGSVREPCSQYLSQWGWSSKGKGGFREHHIDHLLPLYGKDPPFFNSTKDVTRFRHFVQHDDVRGHVADKFIHSYGKEMSGVDCFVFVESFQFSLVDCLQRYEGQGGYVNWTSPLVAEILAAAAAGNNKGSNNNRILLQKVINATTNNNTTTTKNRSKDNPLESPQKFHHGNCEAYFYQQPDDELARMVETGPEEFIYSAFGYQGCCSHGAPAQVSSFYNDARFRGYPTSNNKAGRWRFIGGGIMSMMILGLLLLLVVSNLRRRRRQRQGATSAVSKGGVACYDETDTTLEEEDCVPLKDDYEL